MNLEDVRGSMKAFLAAKPETQLSHDDALSWCGAIESDAATLDDMITFFQALRKMHFCSTSSHMNRSGDSDPTLHSVDTTLFNLLKAAISAGFHRFAQEHEILAEILVIASVIGTSIATLTMYLNTLLIDLLLESVLSNTTFVSKISGTTVMLDLLDLLSKLSQISATHKRLFFTKKFTQFLVYVSSAMMDEVQMTDAFVDLIFNGPFTDPQDARNLSEFHTPFLHSLDKAFKIFTIQRFCGCAYVVSLSSVKLANVVMRTHVPMLAFKILSVIVEISSTDVMEVKQDLLGPLEALNRTLAGALAVTISLFRAKQSVRLIKDSDFLLSVLAILRLYTRNSKESIISNEVCSFSCMLISSLAALSKQFAEQMHEAHVLSLLVDIIDTCVADEMVIVFRSAMASLVEISNSLRGAFGFARMNALFIDMQTHTTPPSTTGKALLSRLVNSFTLYKDDDESVLYFAQFVQIYTAGSASQDPIRQTMLAADVPQILINCCSSTRVVITVKTRCINALANLVRIKSFDRDSLLVTIPKVLSFSLDFMKVCSQKAADPATEISTEGNGSQIPMGALTMEYRRCSSACREVLEILGHSQGRNKIKYVMYSMFLTGCVFLLVFIITRLFPSKFRHPYFD